jgi:hypothetical protein
MNGVETFGLLLRKADLLEAENSETFGLETRDDFAEVSFADGVRFDDRKRAVRHGGADSNRGLSAED